MPEMHQGKQALPRCPGLNILAEDLLHGGEPRNQIHQCYWSQENRMVDDDEEHRFETAGVDFDREYKPSTAAPPQQNLGFQ
jgi:hypothetical protein